MEIAIVCAGLAMVIGLIAYAIYRANRDPMYPPAEREVIVVNSARADRLLNSDEGWAVADEQSYNNEPNKVWLQRWRPRGPMMPPE